MIKIGTLGIANAVHGRLEARPLDGLKQESVQTGRAFLVAPVADPHQVLFRFSSQRPEYGGVGIFMPGLCVLGPASLQVNLPKHVAECENAVKMGEVKLRHLLRRCYGAVMRVVKKEFVCARPGAVAAKGLHKSRIVPFVHEDEVGGLQNAVEVEGAGRVGVLFRSGHAA